MSTMKGGVQTGLSMKRKFHLEELGYEFGKYDSDIGNPVNTYSHLIQVSDGILQWKFINLLSIFNPC